MALTPEEEAEALAVLAKLTSYPKLGTLRSRIEALIAAYGDSHRDAAIALCVLLDKEIGLAGNGWFDNDPVVMTAIAEGSDNG